MLANPVASHPKTHPGLTRPAYLAAPEQRAQVLAAMPQNSGVLQPAAALALEGGTFAASGRGLVVVGAGSGITRLDWGNGLVVGQSVALAGSPSFLAGGDLNGDGQNDVAALQQDSATLSIAFGGTGGALSSSAQRPVSPNAEALLAGDLDGDCRDDLAFTTAGGSVQVLRQFKNGTLGSALVADFPNGGATDLAAGDLDHDGLPDLAALRGTGGETQQLALFNLRNQNLRPAGARRVEDGGFAAHAVAVGDVTGDGRADVVVGAGGNIPDALINIFPQSAGGLLATTPITLSAWHLPEAVAVADLNHDGRNDIVALNSGWMALTLYLGQADGSMAAYESYPLPYSAQYRPETLAITDLNGDGGLDVLIADGDRGATYLLNTSGAPSATISGPAPCSFTGGTLTLSGSLTGASALEVSLDGGGTWQAASVSGGTWSYTASLPKGFYPVVLARAVSGGRVQAPPAELRLRGVPDHGDIYLPIVPRA
ncbi:MAG: hypothetical protein OHK0022_32460 [Roseiflexaceae bacterium]